MNRSVVVLVQQAHSSLCFTISPDLPYPVADTGYKDGIGGGDGGGGEGGQERAVPSYNRVWVELSEYCSEILKTGDYMGSFSRKGPKAYIIKFPEHAAGT